MVSEMMGGVARKHSIASIHSWYVALTLECLLSSWEQKARFGCICREPRLTATRPGAVVWVVAVTEAVMVGVA